MRTSTQTMRGSCGLVAAASLALAPLSILSACASRQTGDRAREIHRAESDLSWLEGAWTTQAWGGTLNADYITRADGFTIGYTHLVKDGSPTPVYHEFEVFGRDAEGHYLVPHPGGKPSPRFALVSHDAQIAIYENPSKDFPTRIVYQRVAGTLVITLSDPVKNSSEPQVFVFTKSPLGVSMN